MKIVIQFKNVKHKYFNLDCHYACKMIPHFLNYYSSSLKGNYWGDNIGAWCQHREENSGQTDHPEEEHGRGVLRGAVPGPRLPRGQWGHILHVSVHIIVSIGDHLSECIHWFEFSWRKSF